MRFQNLEKYLRTKQFFIIPSSFQRHQNLITPSTTYTLNFTHHRQHINTFKNFFHLAISIFGAHTLAECLSFIAMNLGRIV